MDAGILTPSGGLTYHFRALKYRNTLWKDFREQIANWLENWDIPTDEILLIGPSSGYTLPVEWLKRFQRRLAIEPDTIAKSIFRSRVGSTEWIDREWLTVIKGQNGYEFPTFLLEQLLEDYEDVPILFCNFLGQIPILHQKAITTSRPAFEDWKNKFREILKGRKFASYHDIYSSRVDFNFYRESLRGLPPPDPRELWTTPLGVEKVEITDHEIGNLFSGFPHREFFKWQITPKQFHFIEGVRQ